jgi:hypothetical protein
LNTRNNQCYFEDPEWKYIGCFKDDNKRAFKKNISPNKQSTEQCQLNCSSQGFRLTGLQWEGQCFCGNGFDTEKYPQKKQL